MPLLYYPRPGEIVMCRYDDLVIAPEMRKAKPVVVVGPRLRRRQDIVTVVPLSTTEPRPAEDYHYRLALAVPLPPPFDSPVMWVKCDMIGTVSRNRLDRFKLSRSRSGGRTWITGAVSEEQLGAIRAAMLCGLGLANLTKQR